MCVREGRQQEEEVMWTVKGGEMGMGMGRRGAAEEKREMRR